MSIGTKKKQGTDNKTNEGLSTTALMTVLAAVGIAIFVVLIGTLIAVRRTRSVGKGKQHDRGLKEISQFNYRLEFFGSPVKLFFF